MAPSSRDIDALLQALRSRALAHPGVEESVACKGTVIQSASFRVRGKAFRFLRPAQVMVKLGDSLPDAARLAEDNPGSVRTSTAGWVTIPLPLKAPVGANRLHAWVFESYGLFAGAKRSDKARARPAAGSKTRSSSAVRRPTARR